MKNSGSPNPDKRLLIIDDEQDLREVLALLLEDCASEIDQATNGVEAMELIRNHRYDLILSDQRMPKTSGTDLLKWMRQNKIQTPFIIQTGYDQRDFEKEASELGVFAVLGKPWEESTLVATVKKALAT